MSTAAPAAAWLRDRRSSDDEQPPFESAAPDLYLDIVRDDGDALTARVVKGLPQHRKALLWIDGRGLFVIVAMLLQEEQGQITYLRLRPWMAAQMWS